VFFVGCKDENLHWNQTPQFQWKLKNFCELPQKWHSFSFPYLLYTSTAPNVCLMQDFVIFLFLLKLSMMTIICSKLFLNMSKHISSRFCQLLSLNMFKTRNYYYNYLFLYANKLFWRKIKSPILPKPTWNYRGRCVYNNIYWHCLRALFWFSSYVPRHCLAVVPQFGARKKNIVLFTK